MKLRISLVFLMGFAFLACPPPQSDGGGDDGGAGGADGGQDCVNVCAEGAKACEDNGYKVCEAQGNGCRGWSGVTPCKQGEICDQGQCRRNCFEICSKNTSLCEGNGVRYCELQTNGCYEWGPPNSCGAIQVCSGGRCADSCQNQCTENARQCSGSGFVECKKLASGCTEWVNPTACPSGQVCSGGACVPGGTCQNQCTDGATRCTSTGLQQTCVKLASGCTDWALGAACPAGKTCPSSGNSCVTLPCRAGDRQCNGNNVETCDASANWIVTQNCPQACQAGACTNTVTCVPGAVRCNGSNVEICNSSGTAWLYNQTCNVGCNGGVCSDPCTSGDKRCNGNTPETCNAAGTGWTAAAPCPTPCFKGACVDADLLVDGRTLELEGEEMVLNSVVVKNQGQLKVKAPGTGALILRAKTFSVEANSSVVASGVGDSTRGQSTGQLSCYNSGHTGGWIYSTASAVGGGYGTNSTCSRTIYASDGCSCVASDPANVYGTDNQTDIEEGSKDSAGATGGGLFAVYASDAIDVAGSIVANGTGNASGGGILLAADSLTLSGAVQAVGAGCGGKGRIKLLRGSTANVTGSVDGKRSDSVMPPLTLVSGSHPDPTRWYNDGLGDLFVAWSKPFQTVNGYYYKFSTNPADVPSPSNGKFLQAESLAILASSFGQGASYFHVVSVDSGFTVGTVENVLKIQVNTAPPTVTSSSHASESTWYPNNAVYLTWTNPQADANFTGYYYLFDHFADTVPSATQGTFTSSKQLLLSNVADGLWVFHIVNRDTRMATTKAARHFQVRIGAEPAKGNLSGTVFDGSAGNAPLPGVSVHINRGLFGVTTASPSGTYTFNNNLYAGTWEVTVSKTGYVTQKATVTVTAGGAVTQNFTLTK